MGYRSDTAFVVEFVDEEGRDKVLGMLTDDERSLVLDAVTVVGRSVRYHEMYVKWYSTKDMGGVMEGFADIDALEKFLDQAEDASDSGDVPSVGAFCRVGEDDSDLESRYWGYTHPADLGLPEPYDLLALSRSIYVSWEE